MERKQQATYSIYRMMNDDDVGSSWFPLDFEKKPQLPNRKEE